MSRHCSRRAFSRVGLTLCVAVSLSACASGGVADSDVTSASAGAPAGAVDTGTFPNLNIPPRIAAQQITDDQRKTAVGELNGVRESQPTTTARASDDSAELRKIGRTHARDTLKAIRQAD